MKKAKLLSVDSKLPSLDFQTLALNVDIVKVDALLVGKNPKRQFFRDTGNSFHDVTHIGLEPQQIFFVLKYLNNYRC